MSKPIQEKTLLWVVWGQTLTRNGNSSEFIRKRRIDKIKNYSEIVKEVNFDKKPKLAETIESKINETSKRDKMLEFAKRIPKPSTHKNRSLTQKNSRPDSTTQNAGIANTQIEFLENQHQMYQQKLKDLKIN